jgi:hypothetical protein
MKLISSALLSGILLLGAVLPALAQQGYHQNYGGSRVTNQGQIGLYHNDPSYISAGTLGRSARGMPAGMNTGGLPTTSWGGYIRNPGDDIYTGNNGVMRNEKGAIVFRDEIERANYNRWLQNQQQQRMMQYRQMQNQQRVQQGNFYVPGSNGGAANYGSGVSGYGSYKSR